MRMKAEGERGGRERWCWSGGGKGGGWKDEQNGEGEYMRSTADGPMGDLSSFLFNRQPERIMHDRPQPTNLPASSHIVLLSPGRDTSFILPPSCPQQGSPHRHYHYHYRTLNSLPHYPVPPALAHISSRTHARLDRTYQRIPNPELSNTLSTTCSTPRPSRNSPWQHAP